jgi:ArsR family transcriptional regulator
MDAITTLQADVLRALAHPRRLELLHVIADRACDVTSIAEALGISRTNASQHLAVLRAVGVVAAERDGREVRYGLVDPEVTVACEIMRRVLERRLTRLAGLSAAGSSGAVASPNRPVTRGMLPWTTR